MLLLFRLSLASCRRRDNNFDLWEEINAQHFFTRMVQRRALLEGADFAAKLGDKGAADFYRTQANQLTNVLEQHWDGNQRYIREMVATPNWYDRAGKNIATVLAVIHGYNGDGFYSPVNDRVLSTVVKLREDFDEIYKVNQVMRDSEDLPLGAAFGRYKGTPFSLVDCI